MRSRLGLVNMAEIVGHGVIPGSCGPRDPEFGLGNHVIKILVYTRDSLVMTKDRGC